MEVVESGRKPLKLLPHLVRLQNAEGVGVSSCECLLLDMYHLSMALPHSSLHHECLCLTYETCI